MPRTLNEVVADLQQKTAAQEGLLAKGDRASIEQATALETELAALDVEMKDAQAADEQAQVLKRKADERRRFLSEPVRQVPFPGAGGAGTDGAETKIHRDDKGRAIATSRLEGIEAKLDHRPIFGSNGGFWYAVKSYAFENAPRDSVDKVHAWRDLQLKITPAGQHEGADSEGGIFVPPDMTNQIVERMVSMPNFMTGASGMPNVPNFPGADVLTVRGNRLIVPGLDDLSRATGSRHGGVVGYWLEEGGTKTPSSVKFRHLDLRLHKLAVVVYMTDELLQDSAVALDQYVSNKAGDEIRFQTNLAMFSGTGAGQPLGIIRSASRYAVAKEAGQDAASILAENIENMWQRLAPEARSQSMWLYNLDLEAKFQYLALPVGTGGSLLYQPAGGVAVSPYSTLKGRPALPCEFCEAAGTEGDIVLTAWPWYQVITKGGVEQAMSIHVRFLTDETAFRLVYRVDGQPKYNTTLTPFKGSTITATTVTLATRA